MSAARHFALSAVTLVLAACGGDPAPPPPSGPTRIFEDLSAAAGVDIEIVEDWDRLGSQEVGVCVLDVDGRPPLDLYFGGLKLYVARGPFDYVDETAARMPPQRGYPSGCLAIDFDSDGDDDVFVAGYGFELLRNEGDGHFVDATDRLGVVADPNDFYANISAGDIDGDADLDIAVAGWARQDPANPGEIGILLEPTPNILLRQEPLGTFTPVPVADAPAMFLPEKALVVAITDLDLDGAADIYVGNDYGAVYQDHVLKRDVLTGTFADIGGEIGLAYNHRGYGIDTMGWTSTDLDGDGVLDRSVTSGEGDASAIFLYRAEGFYEDVALAAGTLDTQETVRWGDAFIDWDLDGDSDLVESAGNLLPDDLLVEMRVGGTMKQLATVLRNVGDGTFEPAQLDPADPLAEPHSMRGLVIFDGDDDGRPDLVMCPAIEGRVMLLHNVQTPVGHWLRVALRGRAPNLPAVGARVRVLGQSQTVMHERAAGEGYLGSFDPRLFFGLAEPGPVDVVVTWPSGEETRMSGVALDQEILVTEP